MTLLRRFMLLMVVGLGVGLLSPTLAQDETGWEQQVYMTFDNQVGDVVTLTATRDSAVEVPESMYASFRPEDYEAYVTTGVRLSPDGRYLAVSVQNRETGEVYPVTIANMETSECCWFITPLPITQAIHLGEFDPTSQWLSLAYVGQESEGGATVGGMLTAQLPIGDDSVINRVSMEQVYAALPEFGGNAWAFMGAWREDDIRFRPHCYACDAIPEGEYALWQPETNTFQANTGEFFSIQGERLESTGEFVTLAYDPAYEIFPPEGIAAPNVVRYAPSGDPYGADARVIFYNPATPDVGQVHWVYDGRAVMITPTANQPWTLIFRDGTTQQIDGRAGRYFFAGTPDGWIELSGDEEGNGLLMVYDLEQNSFTHTVTFTGGVEAMPIPPLAVLASNPDPQPFPGVPAPSAAELEALRASLPTPTSILQVCADMTDLLPPRLTVGQQGQVTPGLANRVRDLPSLDGSMIGEIPAEGVFDVLEGPLCNRVNMIVWWRVRYGETEGWTAEGADGDYFVQPVG